MRPVAIVVCALGLSVLGCRKPEIVYVPQEVKVPVAIPCPAPDLPARPTLPLNGIGPGSTGDRIVKAYAAALEVAKGYVEQLEAIIRGLRKENP